MLIWSLVPKLVGVAREIVTANYFGRGNEIEGFYFSLLFPSWVAHVLGTSAYQVLASANARVFVVSSSFLTWLALGLLALALPIGLVGLFWEPLCRTVPLGLEPAAIAMSVQAYPLVALASVFSGANIYLWAPLIAYHHNRIVSTVTALTPSIMCVGIPICGALGVPRQFVLPALFLLGQSMEFAVLLSTTLKLRRNNRLEETSKAEIRIRHLRVVLLYAASVTFQSLGWFLVQVAATQLGPGTLSAWNYVFRMLMVPMGVGAQALNLGTLSRMAGLFRANYPEFIVQVRRLTIVVASLAFAFAGILAIFSKDLVKIFLERGQFTSEDSAIIGRLLAISAFIVPAYLLWTITNNLLLATQMRRMVLATSVAQAIVVGAIAGIAPWTKSPDFLGIALAVGCFSSAVVSGALLWMRPHDLR